MREYLTFIDYMSLWSLRTNYGFNKCISFNDGEMCNILSQMSNDIIKLSIRCVKIRGLGIETSRARIIIDARGGDEIVLCLTSLFCI